MIYLSYVFRDLIPTMFFVASLYSIKIFPVYIGKKVILSNKILLIYIVMFAFIVMFDYFFLN